MLLLHLAYSEEDLKFKAKSQIPRKWWAGLFLNWVAKILHPQRGYGFLPGVAGLPSVAAKREGGSRAETSLGTPHSGYPDPVGVGEFFAEDVAGVAGQQNAAPPWGFACLVDFVESTARTGSMFFLSRAKIRNPVGVNSLFLPWRPSCG